MTKKDMILGTIVTILVVIVLILIIALGLPDDAGAQVQAIRIFPGEELTVICDGDILSMEYADDLTAILNCKTKTEALGTVITYCTGTTPWETDDFTVWQEVPCIFIPMTYK